MLRLSNHTMRRAFMPIALGAALSACSGEPETADPPPVTADEERALAKAGEMLDERPGEAEDNAAEAPANPVE